MKSEKTPPNYDDDSVLPRMREWIEMTYGEVEGLPDPRSPSYEGVD